MREKCPITEFCKEVPQVEIIDRHDNTDIKIVNKCQFLGSSEHCVNGDIFTFESRSKVKPVKTYEVNKDVSFEQTKPHLDDYIIK